MEENDEKFLKKFGIGVRKRRLELKLSQESLAEIARVHRTYLADIERGTRNLSLLNISKLAEALDLTVSELFLNYVESTVVEKGK